MLRWASQTLFVKSLFSSDVFLMFLAQGVGNFTINVPLPSSFFYAGNGTYSITVALTAGFGVRFLCRIRVNTCLIADLSVCPQAQYSTVLNFKRINITVTV